MDTTTRLRKWCDDLATAITAKTGGILRVRPNGFALTFECAWDQSGTAILATSIKLPFGASRFASTISADDFARSVWPVIGSWADFHLFWLDQERAT